MLAKFNPERERAKLVEFALDKKKPKMFPISLLKNSEVSPEKTIDVHSLAIETLWIL